MKQSPMTMLIFVVVAGLFLFGLVYPFLNPNAPSSVKKQQVTELTSIDRVDITSVETSKITNSKTNSDEKVLPVGEQTLPETTRVPTFAEMPVIEKKKAFFAYLKPTVEAKNKQILQQRDQLIEWRASIKQGSQLSSENLEALKNLQTDYYVASIELPLAAIDALLKRVDVIPLEMVLVQGANESAWGTSRFARTGYNFFGLWCYKKGCGFVPKQRKGKASHEVAKFSNLADGVDYYFLMLNRHRAYSEFRDLRSELRVNQSSLVAELLLPGIMSYSQRGQAYVDELTSMLKTNRKYM